MRSLFVCLTFAASALDASAQLARCPLVIVDGVRQEPRTGPGEWFGVTAYQCASCSTQKEPDARAAYSFHSEPVILQTTEWTPLRVGDVVEAVNGHPITTRVGAEQFTYPPDGESVVTIRRGGTRTDLRFAPRAACGLDFFVNPNRVQRVEVVRGQTALLRYGMEAYNGAIVIRTGDSVTVRRSEPPQTVRSDSSPTAMVAPSHGRYGFALSCLPSCTRAKARDGSDYWKFDGPPPVAGILPGQPAAMAGLRVGDVVVEIDGFSITSEEGALRFQRSDGRASIQITIERDGKRSHYTLKAR